MVIGLAVTAGGDYDAGYYALFAEKASSVHPLMIPRLMNCAATSQICMNLGVRGPSTAVSTACAAGTHAMGSAFRTIRYGEADIMLAGGADAP